MSIYSDKLAHIQIVINCPYSRMIKTMSWMGFRWMDGPLPWARLNHIYSNELAHIQVIINCPYSIAQLCAHEDTLAHNLDVMSYNLLTTNAPKILELRFCRLISTI